MTDKKCACGMRMPQHNVKCLRANAGYHCGTIPSRFRRENCRHHLGRTKNSHVKNRASHPPVRVMVQAPSKRQPSSRRCTYMTPHPDILSFRSCPRLATKRRAISSWPAHCAACQIVCPIRIKLPSGSTTANSRIPQGLFSIGSMRGIPDAGKFACANCW